MAGAPTFAVATNLVARALGVSTSELLGSLRTATRADLPAICEMRKVSIGTSIRWNDHEYLAWRYRLGREDAGLGELWVVMLQGRLHGMIGAERMQLAHEDQVIDGQRVMDVLVGPEWRDSGLGIWLNLASFRHADVTVAVGANENSIGTVRRLYSMLAPRRTYVHPVDFRAYLAQRLKSRTGAAIAARAGNVVMRCWRGVAGAVADTGLVIQPVHMFDADPEASSLEEGGLRSSLRVHRRPRYMNRRLFDNPRARYEVWEALRDGQREGYIGWRVAVRPDGSKWMHIIDWQMYAPDRRKRTLTALLTIAERDAVRTGCTTVAVTFQGDQDRALLRRRGYFVQAQDEATVVGFHAVESLAHQLADAQWSLTDLSADHDGY